MMAQNENPGALVGATGAIGNDQAITPKDYRKPGRSAMSLYAKDRHQRAAKMLGYALTNPELWAATGLVWAVRLTPNERAALAFAALNSLEPDDAERTAAAAIGSAGAPLPPFLGGMDEARFWASYATRAELKAYTLAAFEAMQAKDQAAFLDYAVGAKAA